MTENEKAAVFDSLNIIRAMASTLPEYARQRIAKEIARIMKTVGEAE